MTSGKLLKKYFWFLRAFQSGPISRAEISRRWLSSPLNDDKKALARSTFYHMKNELEDLFDVSIATNEKGEFYIEQSFKENEEFRKWLLNSLAVESSLEDYANMHGRIMYETIPGGVQYLQTVVDAMQLCYRLIIRYGSFSHEPREFIFAPYAIRIYKQRWYAIGESSDHPGEIRTYAFDRFMQVSTTNSTYAIPDGFDVKKYFSDYIGMTMGEADEVQDIVVRVARKGVSYLRTLPLHKSQKEINTTAEYSDFQFHLAPNFEFMQEILGRGDEAEVLSPQPLRDRFAGIIANLHAKYTK